LYELFALVVEDGTVDRNTEKNVAADNYLYFSCFLVSVMQK